MKCVKPRTTTKKAQRFSREDLRPGDYVMVYQQRKLKLAYEARIICVSATMIHVQYDAGLKADIPFGVGNEKSRVVEITARSQS